MPDSHPAKTDTCCKDCKSIRTTAIVASVISSFVFSSLAIGSYIFFYPKQADQVTTNRSVQMTKNNVTEPNQQIDNSKPNTDYVPPPTPTIVTGPGKYGCDNEGICNGYMDPVRDANCPITFADRNCEGKCGNKENWCKK
jgi:hypothetical protein